MAKQRLSKLQKWILINWDNEKLHKQQQIQPPSTEDSRNSLWIYYNFFGIKTGEPTFQGTSYDDITNELKEKYSSYVKTGLTPNGHYLTYWRAYKVPNKYSVIAYRSLINLEKKGFISLWGKCMCGRGTLLFKLTEEGKEKTLLLNTLSETDKVINIKE